MKKIIAFIMAAFIIFSCAVTAPSWTNYGSDGVYVEYCRDTLSYDQLDSALASHRLTPTWDEWATMKYYSPEKDEMTQFTYTKSDTTYVINKTDSLYIFIARRLNKNIE